MLSEYFTYVLLFRLYYELSGLLPLDDAMYVNQLKKQI